MLVNAAILVGTVLLMEVVAWAVHKYIMHGPGWGWHRSHHVEHEGTLEKNDLYAVLFAGFAVVLVIFSSGQGPLYWVGIGMSVYGALYFFVHDGLVHQRWPFRYVPRNRLPEASRPGAPTPSRRRGPGGRRVLRVPLRAAVRRLKEELQRGRAPLSKDAGT
jgi:beta-carotene 3-hydroxylase